MSHVPVLLNEVLEQLDPKPGDFMIDGTLDGGGHSAAIIAKIMPGAGGVAGAGTAARGATGKFLGVDLDHQMIEARCRDSKFQGTATLRKNVHLVHGNYADIPEILEREKLPRADGLLLDLGFSSEQLDAAGRGFSFKEAYADEPLLMTYNDDQIPVSQILRETSEEDLANIIYEFGGERMSRQIAKAIKERNRRAGGRSDRNGRSGGSIMTAGDLAETIHEALPKSYEHGRIDSATRTFQALRMYANGELNNLKKILDELPNVLAPGGRAAIISFHSLEDGTVKRTFQTLAKEGKVTLLTKKPIEATREEIRDNPRSRSAKLRSLIHDLHTS